MKKDKHYPCLFCTCGHILLKYIYTSNQRGDLYRGKCDGCKTEYEILVSVEIENANK